jgi:AraC-like DNA-binding protein
MDKTCVFLDELAEWVSLSPSPPLCHAARQRTRSFNKPSPLAGLLFQASGDFGEWRVAGKPWFLPVNHLAVGCTHHGSASPEPKDSAELWAVAFNLSGVSAFDYLWKSPVRETTQVGDPARLIAAFQKTANRFVATGNVDPLFIKAALLELFAVARSEFRKSATDIGRRPLAVEQALDWMGDHFHDPEVTLADVADAAGLSMHHFGRTFREVMGESTMTYLRKLRIRHSCGLLQGTALRVNEIARTVGFADPLHFSRIFHETTGKSPRLFRRG